MGIGIALLVWRAWLPHYRPSLDSGEVYGVDVSNHQGDIDWSAVAEDDISFAYIKATEGGDWIDARFDANWDGASAAGLDVGAYHFFTLCRTGVEQADNFLRVVDHAQATLPPALDLEFPNNCSERPTTEWVHREVAAWIDEVESATGEQVVLYVESAFDDRYGIFEAFDRQLWERRILRRPDREWMVWQFSYFADVAGIDGGVDLNVGRLGG
ncbi:MAG: GH25 family lysozyme [Actinomycetota bacterium]